MSSCPTTCTFFCGGNDFNPGLWVRGLKRAITAALTAKPPRTAAATTPTFTAPLWQAGFFDHLLRSSESYAEKWEYVRQNPVRAGLVAHWDDWSYQGEIVVIDRV